MERISDNIARCFTFIACVTVFLLTLSLPSGAPSAQIKACTVWGQLYANDCANQWTGSNWRGCDNPDYAYQAYEPYAPYYVLWKFTRQGTQLRNLHWFYNVGGFKPSDPIKQTIDFTVDATCEGTTTWSVDNPSLCWPSFSMQSPPNCEGKTVTENFTATYASTYARPLTSCPGACCILDYQSGAPEKHFIYPNTGDHMMAMYPPSAGAKGLFQYKKCSNALFWMDRTGGDKKFLGIPTECTDYNTFIAADPEAVNIEGGCYPAVVQACPPAPQRPPHPPHPTCTDSFGTHAHNSSWCVGEWIPQTCTYCPPVYNWQTGVWEDSDQNCYDYECPYCTDWDSCNCGTVIQ